MRACVHACVRACVRACVHRQDPCARTRAGYPIPAQALLPPLLSCRAHPLPRSLPLRPEIGGGWLNSGSVQRTLVRGAHAANTDSRSLLRPHRLPMPRCRRWTLSSICRRRQRHTQAPTRAGAGRRSRAPRSTWPSIMTVERLGERDGKTERERYQEQCPKRGGQCAAAQMRAGWTGRATFFRCRVQKVLGEKGLVGRFSECCMLSHADDQAPPPPCWAGLVSAEHARQGRASSPTLVQRGGALCPPRLR